MNMRLLITIILAIPALGFSSPSASEILEQVRASLPTTPVEISAELVAKDKRGNIETTRNLHFYLDLSQKTSTAQYILSDAFGDETERLNIIRPPHTPTKLVHAYADEKANAPFDIHAPVADLDFSWSDLCLDFLWWTNSTIIREEKKLNRLCYVLEVKPEQTTQKPYSYTHLWIDQKKYALLQADAFNDKKKLVKRLQVKNLKKIKELWTIGDLQVRTYPSRHKTRLRVRDVRVLGQKSIDTTSLN